MLCVSDADCAKCEDDDYFFFPESSQKVFLDGEKMANRAPLYNFKETRLNLESTVPGSIVAIRLPSYGASFRTAQKRQLPTDVPPSDDENGFKQRHLASAASVYYRRHNNFPRSFLWRVLEDGKVLSIQSVDLCKQDKVADTHLTLRLSFTSPIRPACVAFSDAQEHDSVSTFVLTESNHLYTLTLRPDYFRKRTSTEDNVGDWCKIYLSSAFGFKHPHRLVALSTEELLVSLHDGGFLKLDRALREDGSVWRETFYNEGGWTQGLRSLIPFQGSNTVRFGKVNLELSAVTSIACPKITIQGMPYTFTVSLDHRLRVWNLTTGKIAYAGDLMDQERTPNDVGKYVIHPSQSQLVRIYQDNDGKVLVTTFSPVGAGHFKFWSVNSTGDGDLELVDLFPNENLIPPAPTSDVWTLADFITVLSTDNRDVFSLWVLWKNNLSYRVLKVDLAIKSPPKTANLWAGIWMAVANETLADSPLPVLLPSDPADCTEKWLEFILYPGRFTLATIETALSIYERGLGESKGTPSRTSRNLAERMCSLVASTATMDRNAEGRMEYDHFRSAADAQWRRFYRLILELDKLRGEAMSLAFDFEHEMPYVVTADGLGAVRNCSAVELEWHNPENPELPALSRLLTAASVFRDGFSDTLQHSCGAVLAAELFQDPSATDSARLRDFYDKCNLGGQIVDEDYTQLVSNLGGNFKILNQGVYNSLFSTMSVPEDFDQRLERLPLAATGRKAAIKGVQETAELHFSICFDQLMLLVFLDSEVDQEEEGILLDTATIYKQLLIVLRRLELLRWLSKMLLSIPVPRADRSITTKDKSPSPTKKPEDMKTITVLEGCVGHLLGLVTHSGDSTARLLTENLVRLCDPDSDYELQPALIQCFMLKMERPDLALEFSRFCNQDPFSVYIQGRVSLAAKDLTTSAMHFKKAAFEMGHLNVKKGNDRHSSGLLDETEWNLLNAGLPKYYYHILSLFDKDKSYSYVIDFARLALQFATSVSKDAEANQLRTEILCRMFNASLQTSRYDIAYSSLALFTDHTLQHSSLRTLVFRMCESSCAFQLIDLPFLGLQDAVDEILAQKCQGILDVNVGVPYHRILYAWRITKNNFRGAAAVSFDRLQRLQQATDNEKVHSHSLSQDDLETSITREYLGLINALSCVDPKQAWILSEGLHSKPAIGQKNSSLVQERKVVTLENVRKGYQKELDRMAAIENDQFAFTGDDQMDVL